jgi:predicted acylesterase/phospholipase RssA
MESEDAVLSDVREWYGCSGGAACAAVGALGVSAGWIRDAMSMFYPSYASDIREEFVLDLMTHWGVSSLEQYKAYIGRLMDTWEPGSSAWTFADMARERPGIFLGITAVNVSRQRLEMMSVETCPNVRVLDAIGASSAIPFFFKPWVSASGDYYCDGGIMEHFPWTHVRSKEDTLVLVTDYTFIHGAGERTVAINTMNDFMLYVGTALMSTRNKRDNVPKNWIAVNNHTVHWLDLNMDASLRDELFRDGEQSGRGWLAFRKKAAQKGTAQTLPLCEAPGNESCDPDSPAKMSDSPKSRTPSRAPAPSLGLLGASRQPVRRWSL